MPIEHSGQTEEALDHGHVGDVGTPHFIRGRGRAVPQQIEIKHETLTLTLAIWGQFQGKKRNPPGMAGLALGNDTSQPCPPSRASFRA